MFMPAINIVLIFRIAVILSASSYVAWYVYPMFSNDSPNGSYGGYDVLVPWYIYVIYFVAWIVCSVAMFMLRLWARHLFVMLIIISIAMTLMSGYAIYSPVEHFLLYVGLLCDGFIIGLAYYSKVGEMFS